MATMAMMATSRIRRFMDAAYSLGTVARVACESHGGDASVVAAAMGLHVDDLIELSASMNPVFAPDCDLLTRHLPALARYPDPTMATQALAEVLAIDPRLLLLTNGGSEAIALVARQLGRGDIVEPEFSLYRRHLAEVVEGAGRWRSNPSNPLGNLAGDDEAAAVWDEAFYPLAGPSWLVRGEMSFLQVIGGVWPVGV